MSDELIQVQGMEEAMKQIDFLSSFQMNEKYLVPALKKIGGEVRKEEKGHIATFTGSTVKSLANRVTTNGVGSVTATIGSKKRYYIMRFLDSGAQWHDRSSGVTTWRGREQNRTARGAKREAAGYKPNPAFLPAKQLVEWVKKKLGASEGDALHVAFRVAKSIGRDGLKKRPIIQPTLDAKRSQVVSELNAAVNQMVAELGNHGK